MPGFNDAHVHLAPEACATSKSISPVTVAAGDAAADCRSHKGFGPRDWIVGGGWDHTLWAEQQCQRGRISTR